MRLPIILVLAALDFFVQSSSSLPQARVDPVIFQKLATKPTTTIIMHMRDNGLEAVRTKLGTLRHSSRAAKLNTFYKMLKENADSRQSRVLAFLERAKKTTQLSYFQLWNVNGIIVKNVSNKTIQWLTENHPEIERIDSDREHPILDTSTPAEVFTLDPRTKHNARSSINYAYDLCRCEAAHSLGYDGTGVTIGVIDTGILYNHVAIVDSYRGNKGGSFDHEYSWYDPFDFTTVPSDPNGHGTHVAGLSCGKYSFGCATGAKTMACKGCSSSSCTDSALLMCGQFMLCPTNTMGGSPNCTYAPHVINNSWGGGSNDYWYEDVLTNWEVAGIFHTFSSGNMGYAGGCSTANSPADNRGVFSVGSTNSLDEPSNFSGCGPNAFGDVKPEVTAPGENIASAWNTGLYDYVYLDGTSMAAPLVAGAAAIIKGCNPAFTPAKIREIILTNTFVPKVSGSYCVPENETTTYNSRFGFGRLDYYAAVKAATASSASK